MKKGNQLTRKKKTTTKSGNTLITGAFKMKELT